MTGSLTSKNGKYYVIVRIPDENGKPKQKWIPTGIPSEGNNKRKAQQKKTAILAQLEQEIARRNFLSGEILFVDWLDKWMEAKRNAVELNTYEGYCYYMDKHIKPFFGEKNLTLREVTAQHIEDYYAQKVAQGVSPNTILKHNVLIRGALQDAVRKKKIPSNPVNDATLPRRRKFVGKAYNIEQARELLRVVEDKPLKSAVILGLYYGLRRSEVCGLRWRDIDFDAGTMLICNTVVKTKTLIEHEHTKSSASKRTLFLIPETIPYLQSLKAEQDKYRHRLGNTYDDPQGHVCTHANGKPFSPDYITNAFARLLEKYDLPHIRYHELRHTAGSLLLEHGLSAKQIQEFLGHEDISTTLNIYAHLSVEGKKETALAMGGMLQML